MYDSDSRLVRNARVEFNSSIKMPTDRTEGLDELEKRCIQWIPSSKGKEKGWAAGRIQPVLDPFVDPMKGVAVCGGTGMTFADMPGGTMDELEFVGTPKDPNETFPVQTSME